jgi:SOS response regulatory protein OraA/RecX
MEAKLLQRGYEADEVELTLVDLETENYIDDLETARYFIDIQLNRGPVGRRKLFAELKRRGADEDAVTKAVDERLPEDDPNLVREAADRWQSRGGTDPRALARHLERKGFPGHLVMDEVERLSASDEG